VGKKEKKKNSGLSGEANAAKLGTNSRGRGGDREGRRVEILASGRVQASIDTHDQYHFGKGGKGWRASEWMDPAGVRTELGRRLRSMGREGDFGLGP